MTPHPRLIHSDLSGLRYCNQGARILCARYGFDWSTFMRDGIPLSDVEGIDDEMVRLAVVRARARHAREVLAK